MSNPQWPPFSEAFNQWMSSAQVNFKAFGDDAEAAKQAFFAKVAEEMDLVTREEFDTQAQLLERALERLAQLEQKLQSE